MNKDEAINIVMSKYPDREIDNITETDKYFIVNTLPKQKNKNQAIRLVPLNDGLKAVDKKTKQIFTYNPIRH